jgi:transcriptional regulator with XRE-family HTH domain
MSETRMPNNSLPERLEKLRHRLGLSQQAASEAVRCSPTTWSAWETGKTEPGATHLAAIAKLFAVSADYLLGLSEWETPLPPHCWLVDLDVVEALRSDEPQPQLVLDGSEGWAAAIPNRSSIVTSTEYARLSREMAERMATLRKRKPKRR